VLTRLMGGEARAKLDEIDASLVADHHRPKLTDILDSKRLFRPIVWVGIGLASFQQFSGINTVLYYSAVLWDAVGVPESHALARNVIQNGSSIVATIIAAALIDRVGRKPLLIIGTIGMSVTLCILTLIFGTAVMSHGALKLTASAGLFAFVAMILYVMFFSISWGPCMWVLLGEMFPNQIRGSGLAVSGFSQWMSNFAITLTFPLMLGSGIGLGGSYGIYTAFAIISIFFILKFVRETKGKELEQMIG